MTRKILTLALACMMLFALVLSGCSGSGSKSTTAAATTAAATTAAATTAAATTAATTAPAATGGDWDTGSIEFTPLGIDGGGASLQWYSAMPPQDTRNQVWEEMESYISTVYNIDVDMVLTEWSEYPSKLKTLIASGMAPDVFYMSPAIGLLD
ncbi:MAG: hypothetical protein ACI4QB_07690, partial [Eubacteriales bacterium]